MVKVSCVYRYTQLICVPTRLQGVGACINVAVSKPCHSNLGAFFDAFISIDYAPLKAEPFNLVQKSNSILG